MNTEVMFSSNTDQWATPQDFFEKLNNEFDFTLDPCADDTNHKCQKYYTVKQDGLIQSWFGERVFCNPPYGKEIGKWVKKCHDEIFRGGVRHLRYVDTFTNRYKVVSRLHLRESRN